MTEHGTRNPLRKIVRWLRAGYPDGVPQKDYIALFGILHRDLTEDEIEEIALEALRDRLGGEAPDDEDRIRQLIRSRVHEEPSPEDVARVASRLAAGGWPIMPAEEAVESGETGESSQAGETSDEPAQA